MLPKLMAGIEMETNSNHVTKVAPPIPRLEAWQVHH